MHVGVCAIQLRMPENDTLKGKRRVLRSLLARVRSRFNVSIAEVADNDRHRLVSLGISCTSNDPRHANEMLSRVVTFIQDMRGDTEFLDYNLEILTMNENPNYELPLPDLQ